MMSTAKISRRKSMKQTLVFLMYSSLYKFKCCLYNLLKASSRIVNIIKSANRVLFCVTPPSPQEEYFENVYFETHSQDRNAP